MRRMSLLAGLALAVSILLPGSALAAAGGSELPVIGSSAGTCTMDLVTGQGHCVSTGPISHFGVTTTVQDFQAVPTGPGTFSLSTTWTATAANGDQMFGTASGTTSTADGVHFTGVGTWVSSGGTGRFAHASLTMVGTFQSTIVSVEGVIATEPTEVTIVGQLSY